MVESVFGVAALCIVVTILSKVIGKYHGEYSLFISIAAVSIVVVFLITQISPVTELISQLFSFAALDEVYMSVLFKALGICYVTQLACDICKDGGETALATVAELSGKLALTLVCVPLFEVIISVIGELISL